MSVLLKEELYPLVKKWLPEYITYYGDLETKYYCPFGLFMGGFVEYMVIVKKYPLDTEIRMKLDILEYMVLDVLKSIYPDTINVKGGKNIETRYLTGIRLKQMP